MPLTKAGDSHETRIAHHQGLVSGCHEGAKRLNFLSSLVYLLSSPSQKSGKEADSASTRAFSYVLAALLIRTFTVFTQANHDARHDYTQDE